jgi:hypothetical protein
MYDLWTRILRYNVHLNVQWWSLLRRLSGLNRYALDIHLKDSFTTAIDVTQSNNARKIKSSSENYCANARASLHVLILANKIRYQLRSKDDSESCRLATLNDPWYDWRSQAFCGSNRWSWLQALSAHLPITWSPQLWIQVSFMKYFQCRWTASISIQSF